MNRIVQLLLILVIVLAGAALLAWIFGAFSDYPTEQSVWQWVGAVAVVGVGSFLIGAVTHSGKH